MIDKDTKYDTNEFEKILIDTLRVINAIRYPETTQQMNDDKEEIHMRLEQKINAKTALKHKHKTRFKSLYAVAIALLVIFPTAYTAYKIGIRSGERISLQNMVEVTAPYGIIARITLPDSSIVTLNGGSTLTYPVLFDNDRQVNLSGEGFFDIAKNNTTFTVSATHISAKVLGTRFGIKAYDDDRNTILTLEEGCIRAIPVNENGGEGEGILLRPEQQLILNNETGEIHRQSVNTQEYTSWKDGVLTFKNMTWDEIAIILERRFNVNIHIASDKIRNERYVALFKHGESLEQILDKLSHKRPWKYIKCNDTIEIIEN